MLLKVLTILILAVAAIALPGPPRPQNEKRQVVSQTSGPRPVRQDILQMQNDFEMWSLYILALQRVQGASNDYFLSHFQLAGIHGRPYTGWNGWGQTPGAPLTGYCGHNSIIFLPWHRPYIALYEGYIAATVSTIASEYPASSRAAFLDASSRFRLPFWDWAAIPKMPDVVSQPSVTILTKTGNKTIDNPLYTYKFQNPVNATLFPNDPNVAGDWWLANYGHTVRGALTQTSPDSPGNSNFYLSVSNLMANTYSALMKPTTFNEFGTTATPGTSIEAVHNQIHADVGGNFGHMSQLSYSAFDPIFWLHHTNVDRLFALWQAMNPDSYIQPQADIYGNFAIVPGTVETQDTPLEPFSQGGNGPWWTPASARNISTFGYTYPELIHDWQLSTAQLDASVTAAVNALYNPNGKSARKLRRGASHTRTMTKEWSVAVSVSKFDLDGERFIIHLFLGTVPANPDDWPRANIGSFVVFPPPHSMTGPYPQLFTHAEINLDNGLLKNGISFEDVSSVKKFLKGSLQWGVQKFSGEVVPAGEMESLRLIVQDEVATLISAATDRPTYGKKTLHPDVLQGRAGAWDGKS